MPKNIESMDSLFGYGNSQYGLAKSMIARSPIVDNPIPAAPNSELPPRLESSPFLTSIEDCNSPDARLHGFALLAQILKDYPDPKILQPRIMVCSDDLFTIWNQNGETFPPEVREILHRQAKTMIETSPLRSITVRRAFHTPQRDKYPHKYPGGPTFNDIKDPKTAVNSIEGMFKAAKNHGYHLEEDAVISAFLQDWKDPPTLKENGDITEQPIGGEAIVEQSLPDQRIFRIRVVGGENAALNQGGRQIDTFRVAISAQGINVYYSDVYPQKTHILLQRLKQPTPHAQKLTEGITTLQGSDWWQVPVDAMSGINIPLLYDLDLSMIAILMERLYRLEGPHKIEFAVNKRDAAGSKLSVLEVLPWPISHETNGKEHELAKGVLQAVIDGPQGVDYLDKLLKRYKKEGPPIILLSPKFMQTISSRPDLLHRLAAMPRRLVICASTTDTGHSTRALEDAGHQLIPIQPTVSVPSNDTVRVVNHGGINYLEVFYSNEKSQRCHPPIFLTLDQAVASGQTSAEFIGGKADGLAKLHANGFQVPEHSIILTSEFFRHLLKENKLVPLLTKAKNCKSRKGLAECFAEIQDRLRNFPSSTKVHQGILSALGPGVERIAVRSNASFEDRRDAPFAGAFESKLDILANDEQAVSEAILTVIRGYFAPNVASQMFRKFGEEKRYHILQNLSGGVLIQPMMPAKVSGTLFGREITGGQHPDLLVVEANHGVAGVVDGDMAKRRLTVKYDPNLHAFESIAITIDGFTDPLDLNLFRYGSRDTTVLTLKEVEALLALAQRMKEKLRGPQDAEWALTDKGIIFLQARPL